MIFAQIVIIYALLLKKKENIPKKKEEEKKLGEGWGIFPCSFIDIYWLK